MRLVGLQYILDKRKKGKRDRVSYAKVELPHNNFTEGDHIPHEQEYNTRHGVSAIADEVCREIRRVGLQYILDTRKKDMRDRVS